MTTRTAVIRNTNVKNNNAFLRWRRITFNTSDTDGSWCVRIGIAKTFWGQADQAINPLDWNRLVLFSWCKLSPCSKCLMAPFNGRIVEQTDYSQDEAFR